MTMPKLDLLLGDASIKPVCNEMEMHPHFQQPEFFQYLGKHNIVPIGYAPIGSPERPARDTDSGDTTPIEDPVIMRIAERLDVHPAVVCIKWAAQRGQVPIPFSAKQSEYLSNLLAVVENPLTDEEMTAISSIDKNCRLIKGVVFLWEHAKDWKDLWDLDGSIAQ